jgi:hypothetical protein
VLDTYLDGQEGREGYKDREERCNVCRGLDEEIEEGSSKDSSSKDSSNTRAIEVVESKGKTA